MENKPFLFDFSDNDVMSFPEYSCTHKFGKFGNAAKQIFGDSSNVAGGVRDELKHQLGISSREWFQKGVVCEVLRLGDKTWQKGKLRFKVILEFEPDEPPVEQTAASNQSESPLDVIRRQMVN